LQSKEDKYHKAKCCAKDKYLYALEVYITVERHALEARFIAYTYIYYLEKVHE